MMPSTSRSRRRRAPRDIDGLAALAILAAGAAVALVELIASGIGWVVGHRISASLWARGRADGRAALAWMGRGVHPSSWVDHAHRGGTGWGRAVALLGATVVCGIWAGHLLRGRRRDRVATRRDGDPAEWASRREVTSLVVRGTEAGRLVVGRVGRSLVATEARHSLLVVGPSQSGKTSGLVIPALLEWDGPVIATSVKRDLLDATIDRRRALGDVEVFDPTSSAGVPSASWNPLDGAIDWSGAKRVAANLCGVARAGATGLDDASFWYSTTEKLLAPLLFAAANSGLGIADVVRWIDLRLTEEPIARLVELDLPAAWQAAVASFDREDRQLSSVYATAEDVLAAFSDPGVVAVSGSGGIAPQTFFARHAPSIFLVAPARAQERLAPVFVALLGELLDAAFARASSARDGAVRPLLVVLDEAANIAPVRDLDALASTAAGFGIQLVTVFQDTAQIETRYGGRAATVINNHRARVLCSGIADPKTLGEMSTLLGEGEVLAESTSESSGSVTTTWAHERRPLASPDALRRITPGEAVLVYGHLRPVRIRLRPWFSDARLRRLAQRRARRTDGWRWSILGRKETFGEQRVNDPAWTLGTTGAPVVAAGEPGG